MRRFVVALIMAAVVALTVSPASANHALYKSCPNNQYVQAQSRTVGWTSHHFTNTTTQAQFTKWYGGSGDDSHTETTLSWYQSAYVILDADSMSWFILRCVYRA